MYVLGTNSLSNLEQAHPVLALLCHYTIREVDFSVTAGFRTREVQDGYYAQGRTAPGNIVTHVKWPTGKHCGIDGEPPSLAIHMRPYPWPRGAIASAKEWKNLKRFYELIGVARGVYRMLQQFQLIPAELNHVSGGDWDDDHNLDDQRFNDLPHHELRGPAQLILETSKYKLVPGFNTIKGVRFPFELVNYIGRDGV